jgi:TPR repeat protein
MYEKGLGTPKNYTAAMKWYLMAAQQGRPEAEFKVGYLYEQGLGVAQNKPSAIAWYQKSSQQGYPDARDALKALEEQ